MTNQQIEQLYGTFLGMGQAAALKAIYTLGYSNGAGISVDANTVDQAKAATIPTPAQVTSLVTNPRIKKPD
jgi:hypothetical protein